MATRTPRLLLTTLRTLAGLTAAFTLLLQTGCSSVFFYPDQVTYITPDRLNLEFEDVFVETPTEKPSTAGGSPPAPNRKVLFTSFTATPRTSAATS